MRMVVVSLVVFFATGCIAGRWVQEGKTISMRGPSTSTART